MLIEHLVMNVCYMQFGIIYDGDTLFHSNYLLALTVHKLALTAI